MLVGIYERSAPRVLEAERQDEIRRTLPASGIHLLRIGFDWRILWRNEFSEMKDPRPLIGMKFWQAFKIDSSTEWECRLAMRNRVSRTCRCYSPRFTATFNLWLCPTHDGLTMNFWEADKKQMTA